MIQICLLKRRRRGVKVNPKLGGQWNVTKLGGCEATFVPLLPVLQGDYA
jgi:hypothetical protein